MIAWRPEAVGPLGYWHLLLFGGMIPWAGLKAKGRLAARPLPPKKRYFGSVIIQQAVFFAISAWVARDAGIRLFGGYRPTIAHGVVAAAMLAGSVALLRNKWREAVARRSRRLYLITPVDRVDHLLWTGVSLSAGIAEEVTYRGTLFWLLTWLTGSPWAAAALAVLAFGLGHAIQGLRSALLIMGFAAGFHALVWWTGSLYPAILVHFLYDLIAGFSYGRFARETGYPLEPMPPPEPAAAA